MMRQDYFVKREDFSGDVLSAPWEGCKCIKRNCGECGARSWQWHHHGDCPVPSHSVSKIEKKETV